MWCAAATICGGLGPRGAARQRISKQLLRHEHIYRDGKSWTARHQTWVAAQRLADPLAQAALEHMLGHLAAIDAQIAAVDGQLERVASREPWAESVRWLCSFRGIATRTALGLLAEIGDFRRFASPRELMGYLGLTPTEYSSGALQHRGQITKAGNTHARRPLIEAAWNYQHRPHQSARAAKLAEQVARDHRPRVAGADSPVPPPSLADRERETLDGRDQRGRARARRIRLGSDGPSPTPPTTNPRGRRCVTC